MKTKNILSIAAVAVIVFSTMAFTTIKNKKVKVSESAITWKAYKITGSSHEGTIGLKEGNLEFDGKNLTGGSFVVDMSSMACTDLSGDSKSSLEGHLKSDDFFNVKEFPTAKYVIKNVRGKDGTFKVNGDMTIKGKTSTVSLTFIIIIPLLKRGADCAPCV